MSKFDASGNLQWTKQFGPGGPNWPTEVVADGLGNVYVAAAYPNILKFNEDGQLLWTRNIPFSYFNMSDLACDNIGNLYISGHGPSGRGDLDAVLLQIDPEGTRIGERRFGSAGDDYGFAISIDTQGNVFMTGRTDGALEGTNAGRDDVFLARIEGFDVFVAIPEPTSFGLAVIALAAAFGYSRKQTGRW